MCREFCHGLTLRHEQCLDQIGSGGTQTCENAPSISFGPASAQKYPFRSLEMASDSPKSRWSFNRRRLAVASAAAAGMGGLAAIGAITPAAAETAGESCVDEGDGDDWGVNLETNGGCLMPGANAAELCLDRDGDGRGFNPALNEVCDLPGSDERSEARDEANSDPDSDDDTSYDSSYDTSYDTGYETETANETDDLGWSQEEIVANPKPSEPSPELETGPKTVAQLCAAHGGTANYSSSTGEYAKCSVCADPLHLIDEELSWAGNGPNLGTVAQQEYAMECFDIDPVSGDRLAWGEEANTNLDHDQTSHRGVEEPRPIPDNSERPSSDVERNEEDRSQHNSSRHPADLLPVWEPALPDSLANPIVVTAPDGTLVHYDRSLVRVETPMEATGQGLYVADQMGDGHGIVITGRKTPVCIQGIASDPDGDGYGEEHGTVCYAGMVVKRPTNQSPEGIPGVDYLAFDDEGDPYCLPHWTKNLNDCDMDLRSHSMNQADDDHLNYGDEDRPRITPVDGGLLDFNFHNGQDFGKPVEGDGYNSLAFDADGNAFCFPHLTKNFNGCDLELMIHNGGRTEAIDRTEDDVTGLKPSEIPSWNFPDFASADAGW